MTSKIKKFGNIQLKGDEKMSCHWNNEHDACGIGAIVHIDGHRDHQLIDQALTIVERLEHRAGKDATGQVGDGVGILSSLPHQFFVNVTKDLDIVLPDEGNYAVGMLFYLKKRI